MQRALPPGQLAAAQGRAAVEATALGVGFPTIPDVGLTSACPPPPKWGLSCVISRVYQSLCTYLVLFIVTQDVTPVR